MGFNQNVQLIAQSQIAGDIRRGKKAQKAHDQAVRAAHQAALEQDAAILAELQTLNKGLAYIAALLQQQNQRPLN